MVGGVVSTVTIPPGSVAVVGLAVAAVVLPPASAALPAKIWIPSVPLFLNSDRVTVRVVVPDPPMVTFAVAPLVALLRDGTTCAQKEHAAAALCNISTKAPFRAAIAAAGAIVPLVELIRKGPEDVAAAAAFAIGSLAFGSAANRAQIMDADGRRWLEALLAREVVDGIDAEKRQRIVAYALGELDPHVVAAREKAKADVLAAAAEAARAGDDGKKDDKKGKKK